MQEYSEFTKYITREHKELVFTRKPIDGQRLTVVTEQKTKPTEMEKYRKIYERKNERRENKKE